MEHSFRKKLNSFSIFILIGGFLILVRTHVEIYQLYEYMIDYEYHELNKIRPPPVQLSISEIMAVQKEREVIESIFKGNLSDQIMENGGNPIRNFIVTTWRSGSTFLGEIVNSHPGTYYYYEPLLPLGDIQIRSDEQLKKAINIIQNISSCEYERDYIKWGDDHFWFHYYNFRVARHCVTSNKVFCFNPNFLSSMCKLFPYQLTKTVRMRLKHFKHFLDNSKMDIRLVYLVRDPRGTLQSRQHPPWCKYNQHCNNPKLLCSDLEDDYYAVETFKQKYPGRIMVLRYEDLATNVYNTVKNTFKFLRLTYSRQTEMYLDKHTTGELPMVTNTYRNSKFTPFHWINDFKNDFQKVIQIQESCKKAMDLWGYEIALNESHLVSFNPLALSTLS